MRLVAPPHFVMIFQKTYFSCCILLRDQISFFNCLYFMRYLAICVIACYQVCDLINFEIYLSFLIKPFSYMTKKSEQKFKYLENENSFNREIKRIFHRFKRDLSCQKFFQTWEWRVVCWSRSRSVVVCWCSSK